MQTNHKRLSSPYNEPKTEQSRLYSIYMEYRKSIKSSTNIVYFYYDKLNQCSLHKTVIREMKILKSDDESEYEQEQKQVAQVLNQNYNYPQIQEPYQQLYQNQFQITNPQTQNYEQQPNYYPQYQTYVQVVPENTDIINENLTLIQNKQKKDFTLTVLKTWIFQFQMEFVVLVGFIVFIDYSIIAYICSFAALLILIYTLYENHPINKNNPIEFMDKLLHFLYLLTDAFTIFAILDFIDSFELYQIVFSFRYCQFCNLICSMLVFRTDDAQIKIKLILLATLVPSASILACIIVAQQESEMGEMDDSVLVYLIPVIFQLVQVLLTLNLRRVLNEIYSKQNKRIDINNQYTGFILFKYSFYIPF